MLLPCSLHAGRHPLTELLAQGVFIPNNTCLGDVTKHLDSSSSLQQQEIQQQHAQGAADLDTIMAQAVAAAPRMLLITGPNASGKSVYMKQVRGGALGHTRQR